MIDIIKRHEGFKSERNQLTGNRSQISYNSDGHLCIRLLQDYESDVLVVLDRQVTRTLLGFVKSMEREGIPF